MTTNEELRRLVNAWLEGALNKVDPNSMTHVHVDELVSNGGHTSAERLRTITTAYLYTIDSLADRARDVKAILTIPLHDRAHLDCEPPHFDSLPDEMGDETPSIYLIHREMEKRMRAGELYRSLLSSFQLFETHRDDVFVFFEVWRSERGRCDDWEYHRTLFAEHYLPEFQDP